MLTIEQRAHDLAVSLAMKIQEVEIEIKTANASDNDGNVNIDLGKILDIYCKSYDAFCEGFAKRLG